jgi:dethiobiotin synthetase
MLKGIFITGTDTGVGKTYVAAGIAAELKKGGMNVGVMKPVETGCSMRAGRLIPKDALRLMKAAGAHDSPALVNPYCFRKPLAPSIAAELDGGKVDIKRIINAYQILLRRHDFMIVEGAGGIMVPLTHAYTHLDLAFILKLPVVIVARAGLGTINHTLLTIAALKGRGIAIAGVVINHAKHQEKGLAITTNPFIINKMSGVSILATVSHRSHEFGPIVDCLQ